MIEQLRTWCPHDISACPALFCTQPQGFSLQRPHQAVLQAIIHLLPEYYSIKCQRRPKLHSGAWTQSPCAQDSTTELASGWKMGTPMCAYAWQDSETSFGPVPTINSYQKVQVGTGEEDSKA